MDEQQAHDAIEKLADEYVADGYEPIDGEPGEWMTMAHADGRYAVIYPDTIASFETPNAYAAWLAEG